MTIAINTKNRKSSNSSPITLTLKKVNEKCADKYSSFSLYSLELKIFQRISHSQIHFGFQIGLKRDIHDAAKDFGT